MHPTTLETIESQIHLIRGHKVMLDKDLAGLYGVPTKVLNQAVRRNSSRFPGDFMFQLTSEDIKNLRSQFATSSSSPVTMRLRSQIVTLKRGQHLKYLPFAFTEQGVAMLSSVLKSGRAIQVNIAIMRVFARVKELWVRGEHIAAKVTELEERVGTHDREIAAIFSALRQLVEPRKRHPRIGFKPNT
jgi:hypothetical protein